MQEFKKPVHAGATWIMKPIARSQGKGIFLFNKLTQITQWKSDYRWKPDNATVEAYVVQKYIANPYLIGGKKFDLRVYALVTNYSPLTVWIYRSGFTRFSASRYSNDPADIFNTYVHLTNVAVQKTSTDYNPDFGGKWEIGKLKMYLASKYVPTYTLTHTVVCTIVYGVQLHVWSVEVAAFFPIPFCNT
jgi:tubulin polyglutamylase TTLL9